VLIFTDSQGANALGCYGAPLDTPHLDRLAAEGLRFERAYTTCPVCSPARGGLFTGIYPHTNGCWGNSMPLAANVRTLGQRLSRAGIRAGYIGKWHLDAFDYFGDGQCPEGWDPDHWYDMRCYLEELPDDERRRSRQWSPDPEHPTLAENTFAHRCAGRAIRFLEQHADQDFFLTVAFDEPHGPHKCPPEYRRMYENIRHPAKACGLSPRCAPKDTSSRGRRAGDRDAGGSRIPARRRFDTGPGSPPAARQSRPCCPTDPGRSAPCLPAAHRRAR
jgi:uncharacterized sulfatase